MKAARGVVADVVGPVEFVGQEDFERNIVLLGEGNSLVEMRSRQTGRIGDHREHVSTKYPMRGPGKNSRVHSSRLANQGTSQTRDFYPQRSVLGTKFNGDRPMHF